VLKNKFGSTDFLTLHLRQFLKEIYTLTRDIANFDTVGGGNPENLTKASF